MKAFLTMGAASALALASAAPASAQYWRPTPEYQQQQQDYEWQRRQYEYSHDAYESARRDYAEARRDYDRRLADWERARADYDARWGYGAYARMYPRPVWDEAYWARVAPPPHAGYYGAPAAYTNVRCDNNATIGAGVVGAIAGAVLGSNVAARNVRTEGAVLGAVVGGAIGAGVGRANDRYRCDSRGPYFTYNQTLPYRESRYASYPSAYDASYYQRMRCRLAPAPVDPYARDHRYVRVCPDETGRYRIAA